MNDIKVDTMDITVAAIKVRDFIIMIITITFIMDITLVVIMVHIVKAIIEFQYYTVTPR
jgi:hypothetical protein